MVDRSLSGTRDFLPDEMRELRAMTDRVRAVFEHADYGEVYTPALEYEATFTRAHMDTGRPAYRVFDEHGNVLVLRSDMTVPIARLVATRYHDAEPPLRFCYFAHAYRGVRPRRRGGSAASEGAPDQRRTRGAADARRAAGGGCHRDACRPRAARADRRRANHLRPRAGSQPGLLHGRGVPGLRPGLRRPD